MARKTFISYKFSEAVDLREEIINSLGDDASYYKGETADSPDKTDTSTENIKEHLKDMIFDTSVTILIVSPNIKTSKWIDWEIEYSLKEITRADRTSRSNGIVGVIQKVDDSYDWLITSAKNDDGCTTTSHQTSKLYPIINKNRYNLSGDDKYSCPHCQSYSQLDGSYISLIKEDVFLNNPNKYIENAYEKSQEIGNFKITKTR
jgi:hypothetical protein